MAAVSSFNASGDNRIDGLAILNTGSNTGVKWGGTQGTGVTITYSFPDATSSWAVNYSPDDEPTTGFIALNSSQQDAVRTALQYWADVADIDFVEVPDDSGNPGGTFRFGMTAAVGAEFAAWAYLPGSSETAGDVWMSASYQGDDWSDGFIFSVLIHEIGHALGLNHPHDDVLLASHFDWYGYTLMAYRTFAGADISSSWTTRDPQKPMLLDILAIQHIYGENTTFNSGDTTYSWSPGEAILESLWDAGGTDTIDWSNQTQAAVIKLAEGVWSELGPSYSVGDNTTPSMSENRTLTISYGTVIEHAKGGAGSDVIDGNGANNQLEGNGGHDTLSGAAGSDTLIGGTGYDYADYASAFWTGVGVQASLSNPGSNTNHAAGDSYTSIEGLNGSAYNDTLEGNAVVNVLNGNEGRDVLIGRGGADTLNGGAGFDYASYENASSGQWSVVSWVNWNGGESAGDVFASIEGIIGTPYNDTLAVGTGNDHVIGGGGNDGLYGLEGHDTLEGGPGADRHLGDVGFDYASYASSPNGLWVVTSWVNWNSGESYGDTFKSIEGLIGSNHDDTLAVGLGDDHVLGLAGNDRLYGLDGNDTLEGGAGNDTLIGGKHDDQFVFSNGDGVDTFKGFKTGANSDDVILLSMGTNFDTFSEVKAATSNVGNDVVINFGGGDSITLIGRSKSDLHADDFLFA